MRLVIFFISVFLTIFVVDHSTACSPGSSRNSRNPNILTTSHRKINSESQLQTVDRRFDESRKTLEKKVDSPNSINTGRRRDDDGLFDLSNDKPTIHDRRREENHEINSINHPSRSHNSHSSINENMELFGPEQDIGNGYKMTNWLKKKEVDGSLLVSGVIGPCLCMSPSKCPHAVLLDQPCVMPGYKCCTDKNFVFHDHSPERKM